MSARPLENAASQRSPLPWSSRVTPVVAPVINIVEACKDAPADSFPAQVLNCEAWNSRNRPKEILNEIRIQAISECQKVYQEVVTAYTKLLASLVSPPARAEKFKSCPFYDTCLLEIHNFTNTLRDGVSPTDIRALQGVADNLVKVLQTAQRRQFIDFKGKDIPLIFSLSKELKGIEAELYTAQDALSDERILTLVHKTLRSLSHWKTLQTQEIQNSTKDFDVQLEQIKARISELKSLSDLSRICADGLMRSHIHYFGPEHLTQTMRIKGWTDPLHTQPVVDVCILGGGIAGTATAFNTAQRGLSTVVLESGYLIQSYSDNGAENTHTLRTNGRESSFAPDGIAPAGVQDLIGFSKVARETGLRTICAEARKGLESQMGRNLHGNFPAIGDDLETFQITRAEAFTYANTVVERTLNTGRALFCEQCPPASITKTTDGLWRIESESGHVVLARRLGISFGHTGPEGQFTKQIPIIQTLVTKEPEFYLTLGDEHQVSKVASPLHNLLASLEANQPNTAVPVVNERMLGISDVQRLVAALPAKAEILITGSGEAAIKAALEVISINPEVVVVLCSKEKLTCAQLQLPLAPRGVPYISAALFDPEVARTSINDLKNNYGTPVTPESLKSLAEAIQVGRIRLYEFDEHFGTGTVELKTTRGREGVRTEVTLAPSKKTEQALATSHNELKKLNITQAETSAKAGDTICSASMIITAPGFDRAQSHAEHPILKQLVHDGHLVYKKEGSKTKGEFLLSDDRLSSAGDPTLFPLGTLIQECATDSSIPGISARAYYVAAQMHQSLKSPKEPSVKEKALKAIRTDSYPVWQKKYEGPRVTAGLRASPHSAQHVARETFPSSPLLVELETKRLDGTYLTPAECFTVARAHLLLAKHAKLERSQEIKFFIKPSPQKETEHINTRQPLELLLRISRSLSKVWSHS